MAEIEGAIGRQFQSLSIVFVDWLASLFGLDSRSKYIRSSLAMIRNIRHQNALALFLANALTRVIHAQGDYMYI
jgi:hypothetical protein